MLKERFAEGSSWVHQLDPRCKLIITIILAFTIALANNMIVLIQALFLAIILLIIAKLNLKFVVKRLAIINIFILFIWLVVPFTYPGKELFKLGPFFASQEGIIYTLKITIRSNTIMLIIITLLSTSSVSSLSHALYYFYLPDKLIYLFFFVYRYLHVIKNEFDRLYNAMLMRGFKPKSNLHTYKSYAYLFAMLFVKSYERSKKVYEAMLCRGFKGKFYIIDDFNLDKYDLLFVLVFALIIVYFSFLEKGWIIL